MSLQTYLKAVEILENNKEKCSFIGPRSEELVKAAEEALNIKFSELYRKFLKTYGAGNFGSNEIYGIIDDDFENSSIPDAIWYTLTERREVDLPKSLLVIYDTGSDELFCLDFSRLNEKSEPAVVSYIPGVNPNNQKYEVIAADFGDFLWNLIGE